MQYQTVKPGTFISPDDLEESELEFEEPDAPLVEKERPKMDALTHKLFIQYRRMPTEANKQALLERMGIRYDKVVARKKNCRTEKSDVTRDGSLGYADVGFRVMKVTLR